MNDDVAEATIADLPAEYGPEIESQLREAQQRLRVRSRARGGRSEASG